VEHDQVEGESCAARSIAGPDSSLEEIARELPSTVAQPRRRSRSIGGVHHFQNFQV